MDNKPTDHEKLSGVVGYYPKNADEWRFYLKHVMKKWKFHKPAEDDDLFQATNVKTYNRRKDRHGYNPGNPGDDVKVYEEVKLADLVPLAEITKYTRIRKDDQAKRTAAAHSEKEKHDKKDGGGYVRHQMATKFGSK